MSTHANIVEHEINYGSIIGIDDMYQCIWGTITFYEMVWEKIYKWSYQTFIDTKNSVYITNLCIYATCSVFGHPNCMNKQRNK